jgi:hypothetical protein
MRRILLLLACLLILSRPVRADHLWLCSEAGGQYCLAAPLGETRVFLFHSATTGSVASRFTIDVTGAPGTTLLAFESPFGNIGQLGGEQWVGYGCCLRPIAGQSCERDRLLANRDQRRHLR